MMIFPAKAQLFPAILVLLLFAAGCSDGDTAAVPAEAGDPAVADSAGPAWQPGSNGYPPEHVRPVSPAVDSELSTLAGGAGGTWYPVGGGYIHQEQTGIEFFRIAELRGLAKSPEPAWRLDIPAPVGDWVASSRLLYLDLHGYGLLCVDIETGEVLWELVEPSITRTAQDDLHSIALLDRGRMLARISPVVGLLVLGPETGSVIQELELDDAVGLRKFSEKGLLLYTEGSDSGSRPSANYQVAVHPALVFDREALVAVTGANGDIEILGGRALAAREDPTDGTLTLFRRAGGEVYAELLKDYGSTATKLWSLPDPGTSGASIMLAGDGLPGSWPLVVEVNGEDILFRHSAGPWSMGKLPNSGTIVFQSPGENLAPPLPVRVPEVRRGSLVYLGDDGIGFGAVTGMTVYSATDMPAELSSVPGTHGWLLEGQVPELGGSYHFLASALPLRFEFVPEFSGTLELESGLGGTRVLRVQVESDEGPVADSALYSGLGAEIRAVVEAGTRLVVRVEWPGSESEKADEPVGFTSRLLVR